MTGELRFGSGVFCTERELGRSLSSRTKGQLLSLGFTVILFLEGLYFGRVQNIWIDESTQLSGATLSVSQLISWLAGADPGRFGVPPDRMPPVSYLVDSICAHTICISPYDFRVMHLTIAAAGLFVLLRLIGERYGLLAAGLGGCILAFSPRLLETSVEIRAYPLLFAITCFQLRSFYSIATSREWRASNVMAFFVLSLVSIYTHFFGLVSTMSLVIGLLACRVRTRRDLFYLIVLAGTTLICSVGLYPFVTSAAHISAAENVTSGFRSMVNLVPRVVGHPANMMNHSIAILFFASLVILMSISIVRIGTTISGFPPGQMSEPLVGLTVALLVGLLVTLLASRIAQGFDPLKPSYSGWMLPFITILASSVVAQNRWWVTIVAACLVCAGAYGQYAFLTDARLFVHGPERSINEAMGGEPASSSIVYVGPNWAYGYFPIWYQHGAKVAQWLLSADGRIHRITKGGAVDDAPARWTAVSGSKRVLLIAIHTRTYDSLHKHDPRETAALYRTALLASARLSGTHVESEYDVPGLYSSELAILRKTQ